MSQRAAAPSVHPVARRIAVPYSHAGPSRELEKLFQLEPGETLLKSGLVSVRRLGIGGGPGLIRLTNQRLFLLIHYVFRFDYALQFPRGSIEHIESVKLLPGISYLRVTYLASDGPASIDITYALQSPATARMGAPIKVADLMKALQDSWGSDSPSCVD